MSDNLETGPQTIDAILDAQFSEPDEPTEAQEEQPLEAELQVDAEEAPADEDTIEETDETADPEPESQEPQHLNLAEYGDLTIPIVVDGVETAVNLSDAANGYQLRVDYSRKTATLANERKQMEAALGQERAELADKQRLLDEQLAQQIEHEPDWVKMAQDDPLGYLPAREQWNQNQAARAQAQGRSQQVQAAQSHDFQVRTAEIAVRAMPEWATDDGFAKNANGRMAVAMDAGFTETEYNGAVDYRLAVLLEKASRYDAMQSKNAVVEKKLALAPKVLKPGRSKGKQDVQAERRATVNRKLNQPHSMNDALEAFMERTAG